MTLLLIVIILTYYYYYYFYYYDYMTIIFNIVIIVAVIIIIIIIIKEWMATPNKKGGLGIITNKFNFERQRLRKRAALQNSKNENIKQLWQDTSCLGQNIIPDSLL